MQRKNKTLFGITLLSRQRTIENEKQNKTISLSETRLGGRMVLGSDEGALASRQRKSVAIMIRADDFDISLFQFSSYPCQKDWEENGKSAALSP